MPPVFGLPKRQLDTLSFVMEDMVRNIALGTEINCGVSSAGPTSNDYYSANLEIYSDNASCYDILGISFLPFDNGSTRTAYAFLGPDNEHLRLYKSTQAGADFYPVTPPEIKIDATKSGFRVTGAELFPDTQQPKVTIRLAGKMVWKGVESPFDLETTVSQRLIDGE